MNIFNSFKKIAAKTFLGLSIGTICSHALAMDVARIMNVIKFPNNWAHHKVLMSHRGIVGDGCPENSTCSIQNVLNAGVVESIELDVKAASDGGLWLMHDQNLGRMVGNNFNMYTGAGWNPDISTIPSSQLGGYKLKDRKFNATGYYMKSLTSGLQQTAGIVTVLDLKTESAAVTASITARNLGVQNRVILKVSSGWNPGTPSKVGSSFGGVPVAITLYTPNLDAIVDAMKSKSCFVGIPCDPRKLVTSWVDAAIRSSGAGFMFLELGNKDITNPADPLTLFVANYSSTAVATSQFIPTPEYFDSNLSLQNGYVRSNSTCCAELSNYLSKSSNFGSESFDGRPYLITNGAYINFDSLLTDEVISVHYALKRAGYRHMEYYN